MRSFAGRKACGKMASAFGTGPGALRVFGTGLGTQVSQSIYVHSLVTRRGRAGVCYAKMTRYMGVHVRVRVRVRPG